MAILLFLTAFLLSGIAAYYSVIGLTAIFAAAAIPVAVMGGSLEIAKLVVASWLYRYWKHIPFLMKTYFTSALVVLMVVTSMGIFGFLSKAHIEQGVPTGDVAAKISLIEEKIKIERDNIENARAVIKQLDDAVNGINAKGSDREITLRNGQTYTRSAAELALQVRRSQAKDRAALTKQIEEAQGKIVKLQEEKAPLASEIRKVEAEVGPIKYVAAMLYGDDPDQNTLERAVRWLIILLICVFDPLAVIMLIAANLTQMKTWGDKTVKNQDETISVTVHHEENTEPKYEQDDAPVTKEQVEQIKNSVEEHKVTPKTHAYLFKEKSFHTKPEGWNSIGPVVAVPTTTHADSVVRSESETPVVKEETKQEKKEDPLPVKKTTKKVKKELVKTEEPIKKESSKKKVSTKQSKKDKSTSKEGFEPVKITDTTDPVFQMINEGDTVGLEKVYKEIVKELGKKNRAKTTHWSPLKNRK